jgi:hypothetical protein
MQELTETPLKKEGVMNLGEKNKDNLFLRSGLIIVTVTLLFCLTGDMPAIAIAFMAFAAFILTGTGFGIYSKRGFLS